MSKIVTITYILISIFTGNLLFGQNHKSILLPAINQIIAKGLETNFNMKILKKSIEISEINIDAYRGAYDPVLGLNSFLLKGKSPDMQFANKSNFDLYYYQNTKSGLNFNTGAKLLRFDGLQQQTETFNLNGVWFELGVPLLKGLGKNNPENVNLRISQLQYSNSKVKFEARVMNYIKGLAQVYSSLIVTQNLINNYNIIITDLDSSYKDYEALVEKNISPRTELLVVKTALVQVQSHKQQAITELNNQYFKLLQFIGKEGSKAYISEIKNTTNNIEFDEEKVKIYVFDKFSIIDSLVKNAPDYNYLATEKNVAAFKMDAAKNEKLNNLELKLKYNYYSEKSNVDWGNSIILGETNFPGSSFALTLNYSIPVMNRTLKSKYIAQMKSFEISDEQLQKFELERSNDIRNYGFQLIDAIHQYEIQKEIMDLRKQVYENEIIKYKHDQSSQINVLTSNENYVNTLLSLNKSQLHMLLILIDFKYLCNELPTNPSQLNNYQLYSL